MSSQSWVTHQLLAVLLSCAGAEQLHVEESEDSQQLRLQVVGLSHNEEKYRFMLKKKEEERIPPNLHCIAERSNESSDVIGN